MRQYSAVLICSFLLVNFRLNVAQDVIRAYKRGEVVPLMVNKMTSATNLFPIAYYQLPFCLPEGGPRQERAGLGEQLKGDRIESSSYQLKMMEDSFCEILCVTYSGPPERDGQVPNRFVRALQRAVREGYGHNWIVDDLPAMYRYRRPGDFTTDYYGAFPAGFVNPVDGVAYVMNHFDIEIQYSPLEDDPDKGRIVKVTVEPRSMEHKYQTDKNSNMVSHTSSQESTDLCIKQLPPQRASEKILYTYSVKWTKNTYLSRASLWETYLTMDHFIPKQLHWNIIANSLLSGVFLFIIIVSIYNRHLRYDLSDYVKLDRDEEKEELLTESSWKLVHGDVFRPPNFSPLLLSAACGTGAQLVATATLTIISLIIGYLTPARPGDIISTSLAFYEFMGVTAGYVSARLFKTFQGKSWKKIATVTAILFPTSCFPFFFMTNLSAIIQQSTYAIPFSIICGMLTLHAFVCLPLVLCGSYFGFKKEPFHYPVNTNSSPRKIPEQPWYARMPFALAIGGIVPFGASFVEFYLILNSVWRNQYYYDSFGFLLVVLLLVFGHCALITCIFNFSYLNRENYHWWWRSFCVSGSVAICMFLYSIFVYGRRLIHLNEFIFYAGRMSIVSFAFFLMAGFVGFSVTFMFNIHIFGNIRM